MSPIMAPHARVFQEAGKSFEHYPPTCIVMSEAERLWDEGVELEKRMKDCGVDVEYVADPDAPHDWIQVRPIILTVH